MQEPPLSRLIGIAGIQMAVPNDGDNSGAMLRRLESLESLAPWVEVVFFSELCLCGIDVGHAAPMPHPALSPLIGWARQKRRWIIPGSFYEQDGEQVYNTSVVISPQGRIVAKYRKLFPWRPMENCAGGTDFCVFDIPGKGRFGLCICYDQWFPEIARSLAWMGAEAVICPTATATPDRHLEMVMARANAIANQFYWFSLNGLGAGGIGHSLFVDPEGTVLQCSGEGERIMTQVIDLDLVSRTRRYGTLGQCQILKAFAASGLRYPVYREAPKNGRFASLGSVTHYTRLGSPDRGTSAESNRREVGRTPGKSP